MRLLISQRRTDIFNIDSLRTIFVNSSNMMILGLAINDKIIPVGNYASRDEAYEAIRIMTQRLASKSDVVYVPTDEEVKNKDFYKERAANGKKTVRRGKS